MSNSPSGSWNYCSLEILYPSWFLAAWPPSCHSLNSVIFFPPTCCAWRKLRPQLLTSLFLKNCHIWKEEVKIKLCSLFCFVLFSEGRCPVLSSACEGSPCPEETECIADLHEGTYSCLCHGSSTAQCPGESLSVNILWLTLQPSHRDVWLWALSSSLFFNTATVGPSLTFTGSSYVKYRLMENENKEEMKLTMRLRTYSAHAVVMYARGTDYSILEVCHSWYS